MTGIERKICGVLYCCDTLSHGISIFKRILSPPTRVGELDEAPRRHLFQNDKNMFMLSMNLSVSLYNKGMTSCHKGLWCEINQISQTGNEDFFYNLIDTLIK